jgi:hypothetical protein
MPLLVFSKPKVIISSLFFICDVYCLALLVFTSSHLSYPLCSVCADVIGLLRCRSRWGQLCLADGGGTTSVWRSSGVTTETSMASRPQAWQWRGTSFSLVLFFLASSCSLVLGQMCLVMSIAYLRI